MDMKEIGQRIKEARQDKKMYQRELADAVGVTIQYIQMIEAGTRTPSLPVLMKICEVLEIEITI